MKSWNVRVDRTFSSYFVIPMLEKSYASLKDAGLVNVFIGDERHPEYDNHILLLIRPNNSHAQALLSDKSYLPTYVTQYKADNLYNMFVYAVPEKYQEQYNLLVNSEYTYYSKLGAGYVEQTLKCHCYDTTDVVYKIMTKDEYMYEIWEEAINKGLPRDHHIKIPRELEAAERFNMNIEIYREYMMN